MPKYLIERTVPGAGQMSGDDLRHIAGESNKVLRDLGPDVQWVQTYVIDDKLFCVYIAEDEAAVREHAAAGGFPCTDVNRVNTIIDPTTGEVAAA